MVRLFVIAAALLCTPGVIASDEARSTSAFDPEAFLSSYCWECHDDLVQKGDRRLDDLALDPGTDILMAERWEEVMHQLQLGEMPPSDEVQPSDAERRGLIRWVREMGDQVRARTEEERARVTHRRLNRSEYLHTVRDLFGITRGDFDPTTAFPADHEVEGFQNNGHALQTTPQLVEQYFRAADAVIEYVYNLVKAENIDAATWTIDAENPRRVMDGGGSQANGIRVSTAEDGSKHICLAHGLSSPIQVYDGKLFFKDFIVPGLEQSGWYEFTVIASGANREHPYGDALKWGIAERYYQNDKEFYDQNEPIQLGIGTQFGGSPAEQTRTRPNLRVVDELPDNRYVTRTYRVWLDTGSRPYLSFVNGPPKGVKMQFVTNRLWEFDKSVPRIKPEVRNNLTERYKRNQLYYDRYRGPEVHLKKVTMTGPYHDETHPARNILFQGIAPEATTIEDGDLLRAELARIATAFFRRPQRAADFASYAELVESRMADGEKRYDEALRPVLKVFLCSPEFLYLTEVGEGKGERLTRHELANRLALFLHASLPDSSTRRSILESDDLEATLRKEVDRLLDDPRAERFFQPFADQWLGLDDLGSMPPGSEEFPAYYIHELENSGKEETYRFLATLFRENRPVTDLVDADFTYVNRGLAMLYGLEIPPSGEWVRTNLPADSPRRGLPGQASVLTVTSNGVDTSPVIRGVWMLEKLFGTPPAPPPPDVPAIEPDIRGAKTIRDLLEKHREVKACADCHDRIDPLGYAFEEFDPIGRVRETYESGAPIDTRGQYRGVEIDGVGDVRTFLVDHPELLTHHLAEKMLVYALGRELVFQDGDDLERLIEGWKKDGLGLRDLLKRVVISEPFRSL